MIKLKKKPLLCRIGVKSLIEFWKIKNKNTFIYIYIKYKQTTFKLGVKK